MITIARNGESPASVPPKNFGSWCDDENFYFFETQVEAENYIASITTAPTKRDWELQEVEPAIRQHIEAVIRVMPYDYFSINEVNTWLQDAEFGEQAAAVAEWIKECWKYVRTTVDSADINNLPSVEDIINGLPELNII